MRQLYQRGGRKVLFQEPTRCDFNLHRNSAITGAFRSTWLIKQKRLIFLPAMWFVHFIVKTTTRNLKVMSRNERHQLIEPIKTWICHLPVKYWHSCFFFSNLFSSVYQCISCQYLHQFFPFSLNVIKNDKTAFATHLISMKWLFTEYFLGNNVCIRICLDHEIWHYWLEEQFTPKFKFA